MRAPSWSTLRALGLAVLAGYSLNEALLRWWLP